MKELGRTNYVLIVQAVKCQGTFDPQEIFFMFEEQLYIHEADTVWDFLEWCHENDKAFGHGNYEEVFQEFLLTVNA